MKVYVAFKPMLERWLLNNAHFLLTLLGNSEKGAQWSNKHPSIPHGKHTMHRPSIEHHTTWKEAAEIYQPRVVLIDLMASGPWGPLRSISISQLRPMHFQHRIMNYRRMPILQLTPFKASCGQCTSIGSFLSTTHLVGRGTKLTKALKKACGKREWDVWGHFTEVFASPSGLERP